MSEKRRAPRHIRNLSKIGAQLAVVSSVGVPDEFDLVFSDGEIKRCRVIWRTVQKIGVSFLP